MNPSHFGSSLLVALVGLTSILVCSSGCAGKGQGDEGIHYPNASGDSWSLHVDEKQMRDFATSQWKTTITLPGGKLRDVLVDLSPAGESAYSRACCPAGGSIKGSAKAPTRASGRSMGGGSKRRGFSCCIDKTIIPVHGIIAVKRQMPASVGAVIQVFAVEGEVYTSQYRGQLHVALKVRISAGDSTPHGDRNKISLSASSDGRARSMPKRLNGEMKSGSFVHPLRLDQVMIGKRQSESTFMRSQIQRKQKQ